MFLYDLINPKKYDIFFGAFTILFFIVFYCISIVTHQMYLTNSMDMGIYNQYVYIFSHFKGFKSTVYPNYPNGIFFLGDHVTLLLPIESLFFWILGKNVLLYLQIFYIILGATGVYFLVTRLNSALVGLYAAILVYLHYSVYAALSFDYHPNIIGIMLIPWILYFYYTGNTYRFLFIVGLGLLSKEDIPLYYIFVGLFLLADSIQKRDAIKYNFIVILIGISLLYFLFSLYILQKFNPNPNISISNWKFSPEVGKNIREMFINITHNPSQFINIMTNTIEKQEKINLFIYSGGFLIILTGWHYLMPLIPLFLHTLLSSEWTMWGNLYHYNIVLSIWLPVIISNSFNKININLLQVVLGLIIIYQYIIILLNAPLEPLKWSKIQKIFTSQYYFQRYNQREISEMLDIIPKDAVVCASNHLVPHLAFRDKIYMFPNVFDAEYIALLETDCNDKFYPFQNSISCYLEIKKYLQNNNWEIKYRKNGVLLLQKKSYLSP